MQFHHFLTTESEGERKKPVAGKNKKSTSDVASSEVD